MGGDKQGAFGSNILFQLHGNFIKLCVKASEEHDPKSMLVRKSKSTY